MENNVVSLFNRRRVQENAKVSGQTLPEAEPVMPEDPTADGIPNDFQSIAERNRINQERLRREREQANKAVLKSYRIK